MHFHCEKQSDTHAIVDFRAKQWIIDIIKCCHWARTTNIGLLYPKVRNNIGGYSHSLPPYRGHPYIGGVSPASRRSWRQWWCGHGDLVPFADVMLRWCVGLENVCETVDEDCAVTQWSSWSPCSVTCGEGVAQRLRYFLNKDDMIRCQRETQQTQTCTADVLDCDAQSAGIHLLLLFLSSKYKICCSSSSSSSICCVQLKKLGGAWQAEHYTPSLSIFDDSHSRIYLQVTSVSEVFNLGLCLPQTCSHHYVIVWHLSPNSRFPHDISVRT